MIDGSQISTVLHSPVPSSHDASDHQTPRNPHLSNLCLPSDHGTSISMGEQVEKEIKLPTSIELGTLDESTPAAYWLRKVIWAFTAHNGTVRCPNSIILAISIDLKGAAADYI